jgi:hypothetical protein
MKKVLESKILTISLIFLVAILAWFSYYTKPSCHDLSTSHASSRTITGPASNYSKFSANKTLILYLYRAKNLKRKLAFEIFIELGLKYEPKIDYVFILQGIGSSMSLPSFKNIKVYQRNNTCFKFGAFGDTIEWLGGLGSLEDTYTSFVFLSPSVIGPILPKYWPEHVHWSQIFTSSLSNNIHLYGTSMGCSRSVIVETGLVFAVTYQALRVGFESSVFRCHENRSSDLNYGEEILTRFVLKHGMRVDSLLLRHTGRVDWRNESGCELIEGNLTQIKPHPLEQVFYPTWRTRSSTQSAYASEVSTYIEWALDRKYGIE